jgi:hypothetical protein
MTTPEPLSDTDLFGSIETMTNRELGEANADIAERVKHGMLTSAGRRELEQRLKDVQAEIARRAECAEMTARYQS